jgi:hypothetical protein
MQTNRRRWCQFSLLTLLLATFGVGAVMGFAWPHVSHLIEQLYCPAEPQPFFFEDDGDLSY